MDEYTERNLRNLPGFTFVSNRIQSEFTSTNSTVTSLQVQFSICFCCATSHDIYCFQGLFASLTRTFHSLSGGSKFLENETFHVYTNMVNIYQTTYSVDQLWIHHLFALRVPITILHNGVIDCFGHGSFGLASGLWKPVNLIM